jgi:hypothetical protein
VERPYILDEKVYAIDKQNINYEKHNDKLIKNSRNIIIVVNTIILTSTIETKIFKSNTNMMKEPPLP